jgi:hypothetical protein
MFKVRNVCVAVLASALLSGCAGAGIGLGGGSPDVVGDEKGGKIANTLDTPDKQTAAYRTVTTYCEKFGKKGYITKMDYDTGSVAFDCRLITKNKPAG